MGLSCTNFLGMSHYREFEIEVIGDPMPLISVPEAVYFQKSHGVVVPAFISQESICPGDLVLYKWTSPDLAIPNDSYGGKDFRCDALILQHTYTSFYASRMAAYVGGFSAESYRLILEASLQKANGAIRSEKGMAEVTIYPISTPVVSSLRGPSGDVILSEDVVLVPYCFDPDDPANVDGAFAYEYSCIRSYRQDLSQDDSSTRPCENLGAITDMSVTLMPEELVEDVWYVYTLTCSKDTRQHQSSIVFRPRSAASEIPTGTVVQLCRGDCPEYHNPNSDIRLMVQYLAYTDVDIEWSCSVDLAEDDVGSGAFSQPMFTIRAAAIPQTESIECTAKLSRGGKVGEARITIRINSRPYCARESSCVQHERVSESDEFPLAKFKLSGLDFADDQSNALLHTFGCYLDDGSRVTFFKGKQSSYEIGGLGSGRHECFICVVDEYGSETCQTTSVVVAEPTAGITDEIVDNVVGAVETAVASKDIYAVLQSVKTASEIADLAAAASSSDSDGRRRLRSAESAIDREALVASILEVLGDLDPFVSEEFLASAIQLAQMAGSVNSTSLTSIAETLQNGLQISELTGTVYTTEDTVQLVQSDAMVLAALFEESWSSNTARNMLQLYHSLMAYGERLLCANIVLGESDVVTASLPNGTSIALSCLHDRLEDLSDYRHTVSNVTVQFPNRFSTSCGGDCPESLEVKVSVNDNIDLAFDQLTSLPVAGVDDLEALSGIVRLTTDASEGSSPFCSESGCAFLVTIPVVGFDPDKTTACLRMNGAAAEGLNPLIGISYVDGSYNEADGTVTCSTTEFGEIFVAGFTALNIEDIAEGLVETLQDVVASIGSNTEVFGDILHVLPFALWHSV